MSYNNRRCQPNAIHQQYAPKGAKLGQPVEMPDRPDMYAVRRNGKTVLMPMPHGIKAFEERNRIERQEKLTGDAFIVKTNKHVFIDGNNKGTFCNDEPRIDGNNRGAFCNDESQLLKATKSDH